MTKAALRQPLIALVELEVSETEPEDAREMPEFGSADVWFGELKLGDNDPMLLAGERRGGGQMPSIGSTWIWTATGTSLTRSPSSSRR